MSINEPADIYEFDVDYCQLTYGVGACTAALGSNGHKCHNMFKGCQVQDQFRSMAPIGAQDETLEQLDTILASALVATADLWAEFDIDFGSAPAGIIFEIGGGSSGIYLGVDGTDLVLRAGEGAGAPSTETAFVSTPIAPFLGRRGTIMFEVDFSADQVSLWFHDGYFKTLSGPYTGIASAGWPSGVFFGGNNGALGTINGSTAGSSEHDTTDFNGTISEARFYNSTSAPDMTTQVKTVKLCEKGRNLLKGETVFPCVTRFSGVTNSVNIAGTKKELSALGRRASVTMDIEDFPDGDRFFDKYVDERISGVAQTDEGAYNPIDRGTFVSNLKARWPYYSGKPYRRKRGYIVDGEFVLETTQHYILKEISAPDSSGVSRWVAVDVLDLVDDDKTQAPAPSNGYLAADITDSATSFTLTPAGIGDTEYPASGFGVIGSEIMSFTRSGDVITVVTRPTDGTDAKAHNAGDLFQLVLDYSSIRVDDLIEDLLTYTPVPAAFVPKVTKWEPEITRWFSDVLLTTKIVKPTGVAKLIKELSVLGLSIWWDDVNQEIGLKTNRPLDSSDALHIIDDGDLMSSDQVENDSQRLTAVLFYSVQSDPTKSLTSEENYDVIQRVANPDKSRDIEHGSEINRKIFCRWFNQGNEQATRLIARRLLLRFENPPSDYRQVLKADQFDIGLTDVLEVTSRTVTDEVGRATVNRMQVASYKPIGNDEIEILAQAYNIDGRFGYIMANTVTNDYDNATNEEKATGAFIAPNTGVFADGTKAYEII